MGEEKGCRARKKLKAAKWGKLKQPTMNEICSKTNYPMRKETLIIREYLIYAKRKKDKLIKVARLDKLLQYASSIDPSIKGYTTLDTEVEFDEETCRSYILENKSTTIHSFLPATKTTGRQTTFQTVLAEKIIMK